MQRLTSLVAAAALLSSVVAVGCAHPQPAGALNALVGEIVEFDADGHTRKGVVIATPTGLALRDARGALVTAKVTEVRISRRGSGAVDGLLAGTLIGVGLIGLLAVVGSGGADPGPEPGSHADASGGPSDGAFLLLGVVFGAALGGGVGALVGAAVGSDDVYAEPKLVRAAPTGPPGTVVGATLRF